MYKEIVVGKTKSGNELAYRVKDGDALYSIYYKGGGPVPAELSGAWNDTRQIEQAITTYINKDKLCPADQEKKDYRQRTLAAKKRPSKLKLREKKDAKK
jgi:hypothetical protein